MLSTPQVQERVTRFYLDSSGFNGIPAYTLQTDLGVDPRQLKAVLAELIQAGLVSAVFGDVHPNPHIRALPDHPPERQAQLLEQAIELSFCLYPTRRTLERAVNPAHFSGRPFTLMLALGEPQLKHMAFDLSVLEVYRNDPRYYYETDDVSGKIGVRVEHYCSPDMSDRDKVLLQSFGFAYDEQLNRAVAVFLRYLTDLSAEHQQVWHARLLGPDYRLHPDYFRTSVLGDWPERMSVFRAFTGELATINTMCAAIAWPPLFRDDFAERPRGFGFLIRPTLREFNDFVHLLDKMMSENISHGFFRGKVSPEREEVRPDGKVAVHPKGTVQMLEEWFGHSFRTSDPKPLAEAIGAFREVRRLRQKPAHSVDEDEFDRILVHRQRELMIRAYTAVRILRLCLANHPAAQDVEVPRGLREGEIWVY